MDALLRETGLLTLHDDSRLGGIEAAGDVGPQAVFCDSLQTKRGHTSSVAFMPIQIVKELVQHATWAARYKTITNQKEVKRRGKKIRGQILKETRRDSSWATEWNWWTRWTG